MALGDIANGRRRTRIMRSPFAGILFLGAIAAGCSGSGPNPLAPTPASGSSGINQSAAPSGQSGQTTATAEGPQVPPFNLEVILRGAEGFGLVKFRQANDDQTIIVLDVWVRGLLPNHAYRLQRAVDLTPDDVCTGASWLTLGKGLTAAAVMTDESGTGREQLWRDVSTIAEGTPFDIAFRLVDDSTQTPVLTSECYQYVVNR
jgi:hypothetical protein